VRGNVDKASVTAVHHDVNWTRLSSLRGSLLYRPDERLSVTVNGMYQRTIAGGYSEYDQGSAEAHYQPFDFAEPFADTFWMVGGTIKYDAGPVEITSATSYWHRVETQTMDAAELVQNLLALDTYTGPIGLPSATRRTSSARNCALRPRPTGRSSSWAVSSIPRWSRHGRRTMRHRPMPGIRSAARMPIPKGSSIVRTTPIAWSSTPRSARLRTS
jgi:hypothetical protein